MKKNSRCALAVFLFFFLVSPSALNASAEVNPSQQQPLISMDFQDAGLKDIIKAFSVQSGLNFIASEAVQDRKVTLYLDKVPLDKAMDRLFKANNLSYELDKEANIFVVKEWGKMQTETVTRVFMLKYATVSSSSINDEKSRELGSDTSGGEESAAAESAPPAGGSSSSSGSGSSGGSKTNITDVVKGLLSSDGSLIEDYRTNSLIVTDTPNRMENISRVVAALDVPVPQAMLEVEMLDVSKNTIERLGIKYHTDLTRGMFTTVLKGAKISTGFPVPDSFYETGKSLAKTITAGEMDFFNSTSYSTIIDFIKQQSDTKILARPRILTLNNEVAEIKITTLESIGTITLQQGQGTAASSGTSAERIETGVNLRVTPQINPETGEITMFLVPRVRDATQSTFKTEYKDPEERSAKTLVRVKDGDTVIIGGLIRTDRSEVITKLPILGDLPFIGGAFRHKYKDKDKQRELLVFITPHIIREEKDIKLALSNKTPPLPREQQGVPLASGREAVIKKSLQALEREQK